MHSLVECLQLCRDKSQTFLKAGPFSFYPLHVTFLDIPNEQRRCHITAGRTVCIYLPVTIRRGEDRAKETSGAFQAKNGHNAVCSRVETLQMVHESINLNLDPLIWTSVEGLRCQSSDGEEILFHFLLASYNADILSVIICFL